MPAGLREKWEQIQKDLRKRHILEDKISFKVDEDGKCKGLTLIGAVDISVSK